MMKLLALSDEKLIEFIRVGGSREDRAIRQLLKENGPAVKQFVVRNGGSETAAEEVLYEAVTSLVFNIRNEKFEGQSKLSTYLFGIAKRRWYQTVNKEMKLAEKHQGFGTWIDSHEPYEDRMLKDDDQKRILGEVLGVLGKGCREVLLLWGAHYNMEEIAQQMGFKNAQIAMNKKSKCLRQLLQKVEGEPALKKLLSELHFG